jgi:hypothetical protein
MSENSMMAMFQHMTEMQNQFFEQSQVQMQLMAQMLAHLGRSQQDSVRKDLSRIDEIGRELNAIRSQLAAEAKPSAASDESNSRARKKHARKPKQEKRTSEQLLLEVPEESVGTRPAAGSASARPSGQTSSQSRPKPVIPQPAAPAAREDKSDSDRDTIEPAINVSQEFSNPPDTAEAHARLTKRMARLAQERNSRWRRVLSAFGRKPDENRKR